MSSVSCTLGNGCLSGIVFLFRPLKSQHNRNPPCFFLTSTTGDDQDDGLDDDASDDSDENPDEAERARDLAREHGQAVVGLGGPGTGKTTVAG